MMRVVRFVAEQTKSDILPNAGQGFISYLEDDCGSVSFDASFSP